MSSQVMPAKQRIGPPGDAAEARAREEAERFRRLQNDGVRGDGSMARGGRARSRMMARNAACGWQEGATDRRRHVAPARLLC